MHTLCDFGCTFQHVVMPPGAWLPGTKVKCPFLGGEAAGGLCYGEPWEIPKNEGLNGKTMENVGKSPYKWRFLDGNIVDQWAGVLFSPCLRTGGYMFCDGLVKHYRTELINTMIFIILYQ